MSKPWFLKLAMETQSPLAGTIAQVLGNPDASARSAVEDASYEGQAVISVQPSEREDAGVDVIDGEVRTASLSASYRPLDMADDSSE